MQQQETFESVVNRLIKKNNFTMEYTLREERFASSRPMINIIAKNYYISMFELFKLDKIFNIIEIEIEGDSLRILIHGIKKGVE